MSNSVVNLMKGRPVDTYTKTDYMGNVVRRFTVELFDLSDTDKEILVRDMKAYARSQWLKSDRSTPMEDFIDAYVERHKTEHGYTTTTADINPFGAYHWEKGAGIQPVPLDQMPHGKTDEEIKEFKDKIIKSLEQTRFQRAGFNFDLDLSAII